MSSGAVVGMSGVALVLSTLVALPRRGVLERLGVLRSPMWAAALPGSIVIGTVGPIWQPSFASALVVLAAVATPLLAIVALVGVIRMRLPPTLSFVTALALGTLLASGPVHQLSLTIVTALGCLTVGVTLTRLIPPRWLLVGALLMAVVDALFVTTGLGQESAASMRAADQLFGGPHFDRATIASITVDIPDLVLAGVLGGLVAGVRAQHRAAMTLAVLALAANMLIPALRLVPETVPTALTFGLVALWDRVPRASKDGTRSDPPAMPARTQLRLAPTICDARVPGHVHATACDCTGAEMVA